LLWVERRGRGVGLLWLGAWLAVVLLLGTYGGGNMLDQAAGTGAFPGLDAAVRVTGTGWLVLADLFLMPLLVVGVLSVEAGKLTPDGKGYAVPSFLATRPVTTATLVGVKLRALGLTTLVLWGLTLAVALVWAALAGKYGELARHWADWYGPGLRGLSAFILALGGLLVLTWTQAVRGLWIGLGGRVWVVWLALVFGLGFLIAAAMAAGWLNRHPQRSRELLDALPLLLGGLVALKLLAAAAVASRVVRRGLLSGRALAVALGAWAALVAGLTASSWWLLPADLVRLSVLAGVVVLAVPLTQSLLAPLALDWNRHR
jgi:hypothetical protein